ncbi:MAG: hypothetical protein V3U51_00565 [Thermoplasmata archaeon]
MVNRIDVRRTWNGYSTQKKVVVLLLLVIVVPSLIFVFAPRNVVLYVSNQNDDDPYVNMTITVDGDRVYSEMLFVADSHNWQKFSITIWGPFHDFKATNEDNGISVSTAVFTPVQTYVIIDYWGPPAFHNMGDYFTIQSMLAEPAFM